MSPASMLAAAGAVPFALCPSEDQAGLWSFLRQLPDCAQSVGLECGLGAVGDVKAVGVAVARYHRGAHALVPSAGNRRLLQLALRFPEWRRLGAFAADWIEGRLEILRQRVPFIFLEFDRTPEGWRAVPCTFVALDWPLAELDVRFRQQAPLALPGFALVLQTAAKLGARLAEHQVRQLAYCLQRIPAGGIWAHVGVLTGRSLAHPRMSLLLPVRDVASYLSAVGAAADMHGVTNLLQQYAPLCHFGGGPQRVQVDFDVGEEAAGRVGISLLPPEAPGWRGLLAQLVLDGLADEHCATAAEEWCCAPVEENTRAGWRFLSHVKVVFKTGTAPSAKLYFGVGPARLLGTAK